jgi:phosphoesterase RecJ-like protein
MTPEIASPLGPDQLRALELLRRGRRFVVTGHARPDGDCIGAQAAIVRLLASMGKEAWIVNPDPPETRFAYLTRDVAYRAYQSGDLPVHDVAVLLDFSELSRTGPLAPVLSRAPSKKVVIDHHHHHGEPWWDEAFVDTSAAATGLLVYRIAKALGAELDVIAARGVFTSLVTDTGWFKYSNTDAETLAVASEMIALGVKPAEIFDALYQQRSPQHPPSIGKLLSRVEYLANGRLALVTQPASETFDGGEVDTDEVLDILRSVRIVEVVLYLRELKDGTCKLSARSKSQYDVNALVRPLGGGGHRKASGATIRGDLSTVRAQVVAAALAGFDNDAIASGRAASSGDPAPR